MVARRGRGRAPRRWPGRAVRAWRRATSDADDGASPATAARSPPWSRTPARRRPVPAAHRDDDRRRRRDAARRGRRRRRRALPGPAAARGHRALRRHALRVRRADLDVASRCRRCRCRSTSASTTPTGSPSIACAWSRAGCRSRSCPLYSPDGDVPATRSRRCPATSRAVGLSLPAEPCRTRAGTRRRQHARCAGARRCTRVAEASATVGTYRAR